MKSLRKSFKTIIDNKSIWDYHLESKHTVEANLIIETELARIYCGLTIQEMESLPGTFYWASEENAVGIYESKADVLVFYRAQKRVEAILDKMRIDEMNK